MLGFMTKKPIYEDSENRVPQAVTVTSGSNPNTTAEVHSADGDSQTFGSEPHVDPELKLPKLSSLSIIISANLFLQISFFIIVSSSNDYAKYLGGDSTFSGIVIGIPTVFSGLALLPLMRYDRGGYKLPLHISCAASIVGHVLYASAYAANSLYMILVGRIVSGLAFSMWMYCKRYIGDARIVGVRRRTTLAAWLVFGQGCGMAAGPFFGGLLYKVGFSNSIFNGYTSPGWIMAGVWAIFWVLATIYYEDPPSAAPEVLELPVVDTPVNISHTTEAIPESLHSRSRPFLDNSTSDMPLTTLTESPTASSPSSIRTATSVPRYRMSLPEIGVAFAICWCSMTCFFILGGWESNIPVFASSPDAPQFGWSPFASGNFIALGGIATFPFLLANLFVAPRLQDRVILAGGSGIGFVGLLLFVALLAASEDHADHASSILNYGSYLVCWWAVALGFNIASTITMSLLSKQLPPEWNSRTSLAIQYSNYTGRVTGAIWGGSGVKVGMLNYVGLDIVIAGIAGTLFMVLWRDLKTKKG